MAVVDRPLIVYCNIVQTFGWNSPEANAYKEFHQADERFHRRCELIDCHIGLKPGSLLDYVKIVTKHGVGSFWATVYLIDFRHDVVFMRRARIFNAFIQCFLFYRHLTKWWQR